MGRRVKMGVFVVSEIPSIVRKIQKLLAVANDSRGNEHVAANALTLAQKLMLEHNISEHDLGQFVESEIKRGAWVPAPDRKWALMLAQAVATMYTCRVLMSSGTTGFYRFAGRQLNVQVAEMTLPWLVEQVELFYQEGLRVVTARNGRTLTKRQRAEFRRCFKEACALRVWQRAAEIIAKMRNEIPGHKALVVIDNALGQIDESLKDVEKGKNLEPIKAGLGSAMGVLAAERVQLQRQVNS